MKAMGNTPTLAGQRSQCALTRPISFLEGKKRDVRLTDSLCFTAEYTEGLSFLQFKILTLRMS